MTTLVTGATVCAAGWAGVAGGGGVGDLVVDTAHARTTLGWQPKCSQIEQLARTISTR